MIMRGLGNYYNLGLQVLVLLISLSATPSTLSEAGNAKHRSTSTVVVGTVYCDTKTSHFISGATVSMECNNGAFKAVMKTNKRGKFKLPIRSSIKIKGCQVSLVRSNDPYCATSSTSIRHVIKKQDSSHAPLRPQPGVTSSNGLGSQKSLLDPITNGPMLGLGPILQPVLPQLPPFLGLLQPPSPPSFGFPGGAPGFPGLTPSPPAFLIPFPPGIPSSARNDSP